MSNIESTIKLIDEVAEELGLSDDHLEKIKKPDKVVEEKLEIIKDNGKRLRCVGFRSQHSNLLGPYKGGVRFHSEVNREEVVALSMWMTIKTAVAGIPYGGGKGGVRVDAKKLSKTELEKLSREYVRKLGDNFGPWKDVPAPDVNTNGEVMAWMVDEYRKMLDKKGLGSVVNPRASFTGKPVMAGGSEGRDEATGLGGFVVFDNYMKKVGKKPYEVSVAVQGFGNVGYWFCYHAVNAGYKVVAVSNSKEAVYVKDGLDPEKTYDCLKSTGSLSRCMCDQEKCGVEIGEVISNEELLALPVDVLVPAALGGVLGSGNIDKVKASVILELANGPVEFEAGRKFEESGRVIIPDVVANAGGVVVSYFEWVQNLQGWYWEKGEIVDKLEKKMKDSFETVFAEHENSGVSLRKAAYAVALKKLMEVERLRGEG